MPDKPVQAQAAVAAPKVSMFRPVNPKVQNCITCISAKGRSKTVRVVGGVIAAETEQERKFYEDAVEAGELLHAK